MSAIWPEMSLRPEVGVTPMESKPLMAICGAPDRASARVEAGQCQGILAVHLIGKVLREVADAGGKLVAQVGADAVVPDRVVVLDVRGNGLEVLRQVGADKDAARSIGVALAEVPDAPKGGSCR